MKLITRYIREIATSAIQDVLNERDYLRKDRDELFLENQILDTRLRNAENDACVQRDRLRRVNDLVRTAGISNAGLDDVGGVRFIGAVEKVKKLVEKYNKK